MSADDSDSVRELQRLYRSAARERTSMAVDAAILQIACEQARRNRWRWHLAGVALAAAAVLVVVVGEIWQRQRGEAESIRAHYAAITRSYLLDAQAGDDAMARTTRYLFERGEIEGPTQSLDDVPLAAKPQGI